jgi:predicted DNA-binding transcriptional regulator AlpA
MHTLSNTGFLRLRQVIGDPKKVPPLAGIFPVGRSTWFAGIKAGRYPAPVRLSPRITAWRVEDIQKLIQETSDKGNKP